MQGHGPRSASAIGRPGYLLQLWAFLLGQVLSLHSYFRSPTAAIDRGSWAWRGVALDRNQGRLLHRWPSALHDHQHGFSSLPGDFSLGKIPAGAGNPVRLPHQGWLVARTAANRLLARQDL